MPPLYMYNNRWEKSIEEKKNGSTVFNILNKYK